VYQLFWFSSFLLIEIMIISSRISWIVSYSVRLKISPLWVGRNHLIAQDSIPYWLLSQFYSGKLWECSKIIDALERPYCETREFLRKKAEKLRKREMFSCHGTYIRSGLKSFYEVTWKKLINWNHRFSVFHTNSSMNTEIIILARNQIVLVKLKKKKLTILVFSFCWR